MPPAGPRILVVDDEFDIAEILADFFREEGWEVETAENGRDALELVEEHPFQLVITDLMMPVLAGDELVRRIRSLSSDSIPILMMSAGGAAHVAEELGVGFVAKPFDLEQLVERVRGVLGEKERSR